MDASPLLYPLEYFKGYCGLACFGVITFIAVKNRHIKVEIVYLLDNTFVMDVRHLLMFMFSFRLAVTF
jgi:hypothetical protein